jgi:hypothetical protein
MKYVLLFVGTGPSGQVELVCGEKQAAADTEQYEQAASPHDPVSAPRARLTERAWLAAADTRHQVAAAAAPR